MNCFFEHFLGTAWATFEKPLIERDQLGVGSFVGGVSNDWDKWINNTKAIYLYILRIPCMHNINIYAHI